MALPSCRMRRTRSVASLRVRDQGPAPGADKPLTVDIGLKASHGQLEASTAGTVDVERSGLDDGLASTSADARVVGATLAAVSRVPRGARDDDTHDALDTEPVVLVERVRRDAVEVHDAERVAVHDKRDDEL